MTWDLKTVATRLRGEISGNKILAPAPGHSPRDRSLCIKLDEKAPGGFVVNSFAGDDPIECRDYVRKLLDIPAWQPKQPKERWPEYVYRTADGQPYLKVTRTHDKRFFQSRWNGADWENGKPRGPKIPYRLPEMLSAGGSVVFICEGEKDANRLAGLGFVATTASEGAGKWTPDLNRWFRGKTCFVMEDNDDAGRAHGHKVAVNLSKVAAEVRIVRLPGLLEKGDVSDWLDAGGDPGELIDLCRSMPLHGAEIVNLDSASVDKGEKSNRDNIAVRFDAHNREETKQRPKVRDVAAVGDNQAIVTEDEAALRFAERYSGRLRYCVIAHPLAKMVFNKLNQSVRPKISNSAIYSIISIPATYLEHTKYILNTNSKSN